MLATSGGMIDRSPRCKGKTVRFRGKKERRITTNYNMPTWLACKEGAGCSRCPLCIVPAMENGDFMRRFKHRFYNGFLYFGQLATIMVIWQEVFLMLEKYYGIFHMPNHSAGPIMIGFFFLGPLAYLTVTAVWVKQSLPSEATRRDKLAAWVRHIGMLLLIGVIELELLQQIDYLEIVRYADVFEHVRLLVMLAVFLILSGHLIHRYPRCFPKEREES